MKRIAVAAVLAAWVWSGVVMADGVDVSAFVKRDQFKTIQISPKGDYYAATVPLEDRTILVVMRRSDNKVTTSFALGRNTHVDGFAWVNPERLLISVSEKMGALAEPRGTGEIYAINAQGGGAEILVGQRVQGNGLGTKIQPRKVEMVAARLVDDLPADDKNVIIAVMPFSNDPFTRAERMDVYTGRRTPVANAPVRNAHFVTDNAGEVRFAHGFGLENRWKLYYRDARGNDWRLVNDEAVSGTAWQPVGFSADNTVAYLDAVQKSGPNAVLAYETATGKTTQVLRDAVADPARHLYVQGRPIGAVFMDGKPKLAFYDEKDSRARLYRSLEAALAPEPVMITSETDDGRYALVETWSDRSPGDFYLFDTQAKKMSHLLSRRSWFDPAKMAEMRPFSFAARDGLMLHGYLTLPVGRSERNLPMVVMPHGGPYGIQDHWGFDGDVQMLADAGYAVLQLNFRGSGGYGQAFQEAGAKEWGGKMQNDLTDATRWAVGQGYADAKRICIYGGSYGGYAALMGVAKEPDLYRCAVGYVGVYDLPAMQKEDARNSNRMGRWSSEWVGDLASLAAVSPNRMADRIKVPVFLAAGGEDEVAPIAHSKMMEAALVKAGASVETLYYPNEGHGFYLEANRAEFASRLLAFLSRHLGGAVAGTPVPTAAGKAP